MVYRVQDTQWSKHLRFCDRLFTEVSQHPACLDHSILQGNPSGIPLYSGFIF